MNLYNHDYFYDLIYNNKTSDIATYRTYLKEEDNYLELAVGTGRILLQLVDYCGSVFGLDKNDNMLRILESKIETLPRSTQKKIRLAKGDIVSFNIEKAFDVIAIPVSAIFHLKYQEVENCLKCSRMQLKSGGSLIVDILNFERAPWKDWSGQETKYVIKRDEDIFKGTYRYNNHNIDEQHITIDFIAEKNGQILFKERSMMYYLHEAQVATLLKKAGFIIEEILHAYVGSKGQNRLVFVCK